MIKTAHKTQRKPSAAAHGTQHTAPIPAQRHGDNGKGKTQFVPQENKCPEAFASGHFGPGHEPYLIGMLVPNRENPMSGIHHLFPAHPPQKTLDRILHQAADRHRPHKFTAIHLHPDEIACKELWTAAFGDDEQFIDSFLIRYYSRSRMLTAEYEGRTAAMLHLLPFESQLGRTTYIYGVATAPEFRRRGLAGKLMGEAMQLIADRDDDAALLIPSEEWLRGFYAAYGFSGAIPVTFASPDGFDFGTGDPSKDLAMVWRRDASAPMPETLQCSYYKKK